MPNLTTSLPDWIKNSSPEIKAKLAQALGTEINDNDNDGAQKDRWEYHTFHFWLGGDMLQGIDELHRLITELGEQCWQYCQSYPHPGDGSTRIYHFKRRKG